MKKKTRTEPSQVVVNDSPNGCLPSEACVISPSEPQYWAQTKNGNVEPVEVLQDILPSDWRQWLLMLERVGHIIVRYVGVGRYVGRVFDKLYWVGYCGGLSHDGRSSGRHVWR